MAADERMNDSNNNKPTIGRALMIRYERNGMLDLQRTTASLVAVIYTGAAPLFVRRSNAVIVISTLLSIVSLSVLIVVLAP